MKIELFENETIEYKDKNIISTESFDPDKINQKYVKGEIRIVTEQARYPLPSIKSLVESENYILNPDFQRRHRWNIEKKSKLIESFIINVPVPPIFLYEVEYAKYEVMDGLQRMTTIYEFYNDAFELQGLEQWRELNGLKYSQLPTKIKEGIDRRYLSSIILLYETARNPEEAQFMKQLVFERLNSGGELLTPQETRNALYDGKLNRLCIELSRNRKFCRMWNIPEPDERELATGDVRDEVLQNNMYKKMQDVELVLRFFAFRHLEYVSEIKSWEKYFDEFLIKGNSFDISVINKYRDLFNDTIEFVYEVFGDDAFKLYRIRKDKWFWYDRPTKVVYDPLMLVFSQRLNEKEKIIDRKEYIKKGLEEFYKKYYDDFGGRNNNKSDILRRVGLFEDYLNEILNK